MYDTEQLKTAASCIEIANSLGIPKASNGRYVATWRGGHNGNVQIDRDHWWDFKAEEGGDVIELVEKAKGTHFLEACRYIGDIYGVRPVQPVRPMQGNSRYDQLIADGYEEKKRYEYVDVDGETVQFVVRMEHPEKKKEFLQCDPSGRWSVRHIEPVLYNLPGIKESKWVLVVEGEKDADTLIAMGLPATTNAGGSKKWQDSYSNVLVGKDVVLLPDNDDVGRSHIDIIGRSLSGKVKSLRVLALSKIEKGDVTDWVEKEGGTKAKLLERLKSAERWVPPADREVEIAMAKEANREPFANYIEHKIEAPGQKRVNVVKQSRPIQHMIDDAHVRLLGFPKRIGDHMLFDHDRDSKEINYIDDASTLFAWMNQKMGTRVSWARGDSLITKTEFYQGLRMSAEKYESISFVPDYPRRSDVYYAYEDLPAPTEGQKAFEKLMDFFKPESDAFRVMMSAMFCAPMFYRPGIDRPMWIIDSHDGAGVGKSSLASAVAHLYGTVPMQVRKNDLRAEDKLVKRLMSQEGRNARVFLMDNVTGNFRSETLSALVTQPYITGMAPYGKGEETRPNNLTYIMTANSASVDNDIGIRSFYIYVSKAEVHPRWKGEMLAYIDQNRMQILSDIIDRLSTGQKFDEPVHTRFPEFEVEILHKQCKSLSQLKTALASLETSREESNSEEELAGTIQEVITDYLDQYTGFSFSHEYHEVFIPNKILWSIIKDEIDGFETETEACQKVRDLAQNKLLKCINPKI